MKRMVWMLAVSGLAAAAVGQPASFRPLVLPTGTTFGSIGGLSGDGSTVVGTLNGPIGAEGFRWTAAGGVVGLGASGFYAWSVSADGSVVGGTMGDRAARWTAAAGVVAQGTASGYTYSSAGAAISADGLALVGVSRHKTNTLCPFWGTYIHLYESAAFRQIAPGGSLHRLSELHGYGQCFASGVSGDGSVVVGASTSEPSCDGPFEQQGCVWSGSGNASGIGFLPGHTASGALAVSADGSVVVGWSGWPQQACRWTVGGGLAGLSAGPEWQTTAAKAVSADGSVIVGTGGVNGNPVALIWDATHGVRDLRAVLEGLGVQTVGWELRNPVGISADGRTVAGWGLNPAQQTQGWVVYLGDPVAGCYPNCDGSTAAPLLNVLDFSCFLNRFAAGDSHANCDGSTGTPALNVLDFSCFLNAFAAGCS